MLSSAERMIYSLVAHAVLDSVYEKGLHFVSMINLLPARILPSVASEFPYACTVSILVMWCRVRVVKKVLRWVSGMNSSLLPIRVPPKTAGTGCVGGGMTCACFEQPREGFFREGVLAPSSAAKQGKGMKGIRLIHYLEYFCLDHTRALGSLGSKRCCISLKCVEVPPDFATLRVNVGRQFESTQHALVCFRKIRLKRAQVFGISQTRGSELDYRVTKFIILEIQSMGDWKKSRKLMKTPSHLSRFT